MSLKAHRSSSGPAWSVDVDSRLTTQDLDFFQKQVLRRCGVTLQQSKSALIESRLRKRLIALGFSNFKEYRDFLVTPASEIEEWQSVVNSLTTHTTEWFREIEHFHDLKNRFIPDWLAAKISRPLRVWSVACSTGEEPYSIALLLNQFHQTSGLNYEIFATDIDTEVVQKAKSGIYSVDDLKKIPQEFHSNALAKGVGKSQGLMKIRSHIRDRIHFSQINLTRFPYKIDQSFDLIFCRNVLIYFSPETIEKVAHALHQAANPGALLLTGHSETFSNLDVPWTFVKPTHYRKSGAKS